MRWRRIGFWAGLGALALVVLTLTWLWTADLGVFKPQLERFLTQELGREFRIDGEFHVDLSRSTTVIAEDIRLANPDWADEPHMVVVGRAEARIDLWSLISGPFIIELVDIDDVSVQLLNPGDRAPNWAFDTDPPPPVEEAKPGLDFLVEELYVDNATVMLDSVDRVRTLQLELTYLRQRSRDDGMLELDADATLDGRVVRAEGELGTFKALLDGKDVRFDIKAVLDTFEFTGSGLIDDLAAPVRPELVFTAIGPDIDDLTTLLGLGDEGDGDIDLSGAVRKIEDQRLLLELTGNVGETEIESRGMVSDLQNLRDIDFDLSASGPDLGRILRIAGVHQVRQAPFRARINAKTVGREFIIEEGSMVFADARIDVTGRMPNFPSIDDAVVRLLIEGSDIARFRYVTGLPGAAEGAFRLGFTIDVAEDGFELLQLDIETELGEIHGSGKLGHPPKFFDSTFELDLRSDSLERVAGAYGVEGMPDYPFEIQGSARYVEEGLRTLSPMAATVGNVSATVGGLLTFTRGVVGSDVQFTLEGPDLSNLVGAFADAGGVPPRPYDVAGRMQVRDDGYRFHAVSGTIGTSAIEIDGILTNRSGLAGSRFDIAAGGPAFEELAGDIEGLEVREGPYQLSGRIELQPNLVRFEGVNFERTNVDLSLDLDLGLPVSERRIGYDLRARGPDVRDIIQGVGPLRLKKLPVSIDAQGRTDGDKIIFDEFDVAIGDATTETRGEIELSDEGGRSRLYWSVDIPSIRRLVTLNGTEFRDLGASLNADLAGNGGDLRVDNLVARLGESHVRGQIHLKGDDVPELEVALVSDGIVLDPLLEPGEEEETYDPEPEFDDGRLIPDIALPFDAMKKLNASVDVDIKSLQRGALVMRDIVLDASLEDGTLDIPVAGFKGRSGEILAKARLGPADGPGAATLQLLARDFALGMAQTNLDAAMTGDIDINLHATGNDLRTLLGNTNGVIFINTRGGRITNNRFVRAIYGDLLEGILDTVNPFRETDPYTDFECAVVSVSIDDGLLTGRPSSFISTDKIRVITKSSINLKTEEMRVGIRTTPRRALSISAGELVNPYVQVVGTLAAPRLAVDEKGLLITGGAAVATGGLSLLARGLWDRLSRSGDACKQASDQGIAEIGERFPDLVIEGTSRLE